MTTPIQHIQYLETSRLMHFDKGQFMPRLVSIFCVLTTLAAMPVRAATTTINISATYQTIEGLGGATCFWVGNLTGHPYKLEIYTNIFAGLNLSMLRLGDWYRYQSSITTFDSAAFDVVANANRVLGHPVQVYMSSWAPPAFLKSNGQVANGGTLITNSDGTFAYDRFAQYWYDSLQAYKSNGVSPKWISIQNEPDWVAGYDSCVFHPTEDTVNGTNYASYSKALDAVYGKLTNLPAPPKLLAPEVVHIAYNDLANYAATLHSNSFYGINYHLYGGNNSDLSSSTNIFPSKPHFMTEFGVDDLIGAATLIHNCLTLGQDSGFNFWNLAWPVPGGGLVEIENGGNSSSWTNAPAALTESHGWYRMPSYWAMKHFSYFINPGFKRVSATDNDSNVSSSAYLSPDGLRLVVVLINSSASASSSMSFNFGTFSVGKSSAYQTAGTNTVACTNTFLSLGSLASPQALPPQSVTTVVLDQNVYVGPATNPSPTNGAAGIAWNSPLSWTPGSNALAHAVYLGTDSNAVAQAIPASPQFLGIVTTTNLYPLLAGGTANFWRVDEMIGANTNIGTVWSFSTVPVPALAHRYSFSEAGGASTADAAGGPAWTGTLPNGGTLSGGQLALTGGSSQYAGLPAGIVSTLSNFTMEAWVKLNSTTNWNRIFDFGNNTTTYMFLTPQNGSTSRLRFAITTSGNGGEQQITGTSALAAGNWYHVVVTLNGNTGILYLNGVAVGTNNAMTLKPSSLGSTANNYIGKSQWPDPYLNGSIDEFRIYNVALSSAEVAATDALGPDQLLSPNSPVAAFSMSGTNLNMSWPVASAGFTLQSATNLTSGNWAAVTAAVLQIVGTNYLLTFPATNALQFFRLVK